MRSWVSRRPLLFSFRPSFGEENKRYLAPLPSSNLPYTDNSKQMFTGWTADIGEHYPQYSDKPLAVARLWLESRIELPKDVVRRTTSASTTELSPAGPTETTPTSQAESTPTNPSRTSSKPPWEERIQFLDPCHVRPLSWHNVAVALDLFGHLLAKGTILFSYEYADVWIHFAIYLVHQLASCLEDALRRVVKHSFLGGSPADNVGAVSGWPTDFSCRSWIQVFQSIALLGSVGLFGLLLQRSASLL